MISESSRWEAGWFREKGSISGKQGSYMGIL
ncbi:hypothetical protein A2U01_0088690, partial [Trifolium medium]|nr:hypothetical protein [Trifolium medium]